MIVASFVTVFAALAAAWLALHLRSAKVKAGDWVRMRHGTYSERSIRMYVQEAQRDRLFVQRIVGSNGVWVRRKSVRKV